MEPSRTLQDADQGCWRNVPEEITAKIMCRLAVPDFCTCRAVCKAWNELLRRPAFLDLCDQDEQKDDSPYLFVTVHYFRHGTEPFTCKFVDANVDGRYRHTTCFLDLRKRRWFSIGSLRVPYCAEFPLHLAMNDGLICEFSVVGKECRLVMFDPVSATTRALPALPGPASRLFREAPPAIVTVVHNDSHFNVFLLSRSKGPHMGFVLYESSTDAWRDLRSPTEEFEVAEAVRGRLVQSVIYFQGTFYAAFRTYSGLLLGRYNLEENSWKEVFTVKSLYPGHPELIVFKNRLFMPIWLDGEGTDPKLGRDWYILKTSTFEVREIMEDSSSKSVVQIPSVEIARLFYWEKKLAVQLETACGFPIDSHSVLLVAGYLRKLFVYNVMSGCGAELPAHPLSQASFEHFEATGCHVTMSAKVMNLSVRNILASSSSPVVACTREPILRLPA